MFECGVREKTIREEIEDLDLDQHDRDRIIKKYECEKAKEAERIERDFRQLRETVDQQAIEIKALTGYIAMKCM